MTKSDAPLPPNAQSYADPDVAGLLGRLDDMDRPRPPNDQAIMPDLIADAGSNGLEWIIEWIIEGIFSFFGNV